MKTVYIALLLVLTGGAHSMEGRDNDMGFDSTPALRSQISNLQGADPFEATDPFEALSTIDGWDEVMKKGNGEDLTLRAVAYKLKTKFDMNVTHQTLQESEVFEQFIIDYARSLTVDHPFLQNINVHGNARWFPCDPLGQHHLIVVYPTLTPDQRKCIVGIYNTAYNSMATYTEDLLRSYGVEVENLNLGFSLLHSIAFRKEFFFKHVFGAPQAEQKIENAENPYEWDMVAQKGYNVAYTQDAIAYKLKTNFGLDVTESQFLEQFIINHARSLCNEQTDLDNGNVNGAHWLPCDPYFPHVMLISYPSLSDAQRLYLATVYNTTYGKMAMPTHKIYVGGDIPGFDIKNAVAFNKAQFFKYVLK